MILQSIFSDKKIQFMYNYIKYDFFQAQSKLHCNPIIVYSQIQILLHLSNWIQIILESHTGLH